MNVMDGTRRAARRVARRPVAVLLAAVIGLGGLGFATGTALGAAGAAGSHDARGHLHDGPGHGARPPRQVGP